MPPETDDKNTAPPSTLTAIGKGLDVTQGKGVERWGPAAFGILYIIGLFLPSFLAIPNETVYYTAFGTIAPYGIAWVAKIGAT